MEQIMYSYAVSNYQTAAGILAADLQTAAAYIADALRVDASEIAAALAAGIREDGFGEYGPYTVDIIPV